MIEKDQLTDLYEREIKDRLTGLESVRKTIARRQVAGIALLVLPIVLFFVFSEVANENNFSSLPDLMRWIPFLFIAMVLAGIVFLILNYIKKREYRRRYKDEVVSKILKAIDPEWDYAADDCISSSEYNQSGLFRQSYDRYRGDDLIYGQIEKTDFRCSELHTEYKTVSTDKDGKRKETWHTIFKGLFFHADFNKNINAQTFIEPDNSERLLGKFGQKLQFSSKGKLVKLENPDFEKIFAVFSTDQTEARYILTPAIMEALVNIYRQYKRKLYLSFTGSRVYVAMSFKKNLFEPKIFRSGVKFEDVEFMYNLFLLNAVIIHELNLNTRIWTKE